MRTGEGKRLYIMKTAILDIVSIVVLVIILFFGVQFSVQRYVVDGPSMLQTFHDKQMLMINKIFYYLHEPKRGDVIVFQMDELSETAYIKRVIGLPGETVEVKDGVVYVTRTDGKVLKLDEPYVADPARAGFNGEKIPENEYFVMGDNRNDSSDSRTGWTVPRESIIGKAWISLSFNSFGLIENYAYAGN